MAFPHFRPLHVLAARNAGISAPISGRPAVPENKLGETIETLLRDYSSAKLSGNNGLKLVEDMKGATQKTYSILANLIK